MSSEKIVFCIFGSLGDIHPIQAVARKLKDAAARATLLGIRELVLPKEEHQ